MHRTISRKNLHFEQETIVLRVRWYLRHRLSYRDLVETMAEKGLSIVHTTILRCVRRYIPEFEKRWSRFSVQAGTSWQVDETCVGIRGPWLISAGPSLPQADRRLPAQSRGAVSPRPRQSPQSPMFSRLLARDYHAGRLCRFPPGRSGTSTARQPCRPTQSARTHPNNDPFKDKEPHGLRLSSASMSQTGYGEGFLTAIRYTSSCTPR